jgi:type IV pilus assembly protein PilN
MRLDINLATQPYQDVKRYVIRRGVPLLLFAVASTWFCWSTVHSWMHSRDVNAQIERVNREIKTLDEERGRAQALLARPENRVLVEQSRLLNQLIARKAFSWISVFMQLESIMPAQLRVVQISPELNQQNELELRLLVSGNSREQALELVRRLEKSPYFARPQLRAETMLPDAVQFDISALYIPRSNEAPKSSEQNSATPEKQAVANTAATAHAGKEGR